MTETLRKERDDLCKRIARAMNDLSQVKEAIEHDRLEEAASLLNLLKTAGINLPNHIKDYIERSKLHSV